MLVAAVKSADHNARRPFGIYTRKEPCAWQAKNLADAFCIPRMAAALIEITIRAGERGQLSHCKSPLESNCAISISAMPLLRL